MDNCVLFSIYYFCIHKKNDVYKTFAWQRNGWCWKPQLKIFLKSWHCWIIWYLLAGFKVCVLFTMKYVFSVKIWFIKTTTRILKYKSQVVKSNPGNCYIHDSIIKRHYHIAWEEIICNICFKSNLLSHINLCIFFCLTPKINQD